jgi:hypothetical protein
MHGIIEHKKAAARVLYICDAVVIFALYLVVKWVLLLITNRP